mgnify:FL=1
MKIRHAILIWLILNIGLIIFQTAPLPISFQIKETIISITGILLLASFGLIIYLIIRNIFHAAKKEGNKT